MDNSSSKNQTSSNTTITHIVYGLLAISIFTYITLIIAGALAYYKKNEITGTNLESHSVWQIQTFWFTLGGFALGHITKFIVVGHLFIWAACAWIAYRVFMGWRALYEGKDINQTSS